MNGRNEKNRTRGMSGPRITESEKQMLIKMEKTFRSCNQMYFNGCLKLPKFAIKRKADFIGLFTCDNTRVQLREGKLYYIRRNQPTIVFNMEYATICDEEFENTIVHEMVHQWVFQNYAYVVRKGHGKEFHAMCAKLKHDYGLTITTYAENLNENKIK